MQREIGFVSDGLIWGLMDVGLRDKRHQKLTPVAEREGRSATVMIGNLRFQTFQMREFY